MFHRPYGLCLPLLVAALGATATKVRADEAPQVVTDAEVKNNRADTLDGSQSTWSGQLNFNYLGSSINHPFAKDAPNPSGQVPPPLAELQGTVAVRYRLNGSTTMGLATGVTTVTPLQGQKHTTVANPQIDLANTIKFGHWHQYADLVLIRYTDYQYHIQYGYEWSPGLSEEFAYYFDSGFTFGLQGTLNYTTFARGDDYDRGQQLEIQLVGGPFAEYAINDIFSVRSVVNAEQDHNRDMSDRYLYHYPKVTQTLGLASQLSKSVWLYVYAQVIPYSGERITAKNTMAGLQTVINLF